VVNDFVIPSKNK